MRGPSIAWLLVVHILRPSAVFAAPATAPSGSTASGERRGFVVGVAAGRGWTSPGLCAFDTGSFADSPTCGGGLAVTGLRLGARVGRASAIVLDYEQAVERDEVSVVAFGRTLWNHRVLAGAFQYWPATSFWVKAGVGIGVVDRGLSQRTSHVAGLVGTGYEVARTRKLALDVQMHLLGTVGPFPAEQTLFGEKARYQGVIKSVTVALGVNWYR